VLLLLLLSFFLSFVSPALWTEVTKVMTAKAARPRGAGLETVLFSTTIRGRSIELVHSCERKSRPVARRRLPWRRLDAEVLPWC